MINDDINQTRRYYDCAILYNIFVTYLLHIFESNKIIDMNSINNFDLFLC